MKNAGDYTYNLGVKFKAGGFNAKGQTRTMNLDNYEIRHKENCVRVIVEELVAKDRDTYYFVDKLFEYDHGLHGATHTGIVGVTEEYVEERLEELRDYEYSPYAYLYHEDQTPQSWDEWINEWIEADGEAIIIDSSGSQYWDVVEEKFEEENDLEFYTTDCVSGGRMTSLYEQEVDVIYNQELWALVQEVEENGLKALLAQQGE